MSTLPPAAGSATPLSASTSRARAAVRLAAALPLTALHALLPLGAAAVTLGNGTAVARAGTRAFRSLSRLVVPLLGVRATVAGVGIPPGPCVLCPNHVSYLDVLLVAGAADAVFVSRADLARWPGIGPLSRLAGTVFIDRERRRDASAAGDAVGRWLDRGFRVVVFLEGRNGTGGAVLPFRSPLLEPACARGLPCVPLAIRYDASPTPGAVVARDVAWADDTPFGEHALRLAGMRGMFAQVTVGAARRDADRKRLAAALEADVRAMLGQDGATAPADPSPDR